jgi:chemotaxis protein CheD
MPSPLLTGFVQRVVVGIADMAVSNNPDVILATHSLGSCLGITIYDPVVKAGGLVHVMLPDSSIDPIKAREKPAMFVDTGIAALFRAAYELKADKHRVIICVAGGAQVLDTSNYFNIGQRNFDALSAILNSHGLRIHAAQVGGLCSRSMFLHLATGEVKLKISGQSNDVILWRNSTIT